LLQLVVAVAAEALSLLKTVAVKVAAVVKTVPQVTALGLQEEQLELVAALTAKMRL
jgi:hypothetical protein